MSQTPIVPMTDTASDNNEPLARHNTRATLERLLGELTARPERHDEIVHSVEDIFGQDKAVMVLDMTGFARTTRRHGIVTFLLMIHQMKLIARPLIEGHGGILVKAEADNLFCLFDTAAAAIRAAREIVQRLETANLLLPEERRLYAAVGIGYGRILNVEDQDLFGDEVNLACKLGEDVAEGGVILLTPAAREHTPDDDIRTREQSLSVSGLTLSYHVLEKEVVSES